MNRRKFFKSLCFMPIILLIPEAEDVPIRWCENLKNLDCNFEPVRRVQFDDGYHWTHKCDDGLIRTEWIEIEKNLRNVKILESYQRYTLEQMVEEHCKNGYILHGGLVVICHPDSSLVYIQAVIKQESHNVFKEQIKCCAN